MNIYQSLLFQNGHIADAKLALSLVQTDTANDDAATPPPSRLRKRSHGLRWVLEELVLLGGRPVSSQHLDDIDEPFPTLHPCH